MKCREILGSDTVNAMARARDFLAARPVADLLGFVGRTVGDVALRAGAADKAAFPASYGGGKPCDDDLLAGLGVFYVTESGKVMLDCTSGHYQMTWGYNHPGLCAAAREAMDLGIVWDNHSNIPSAPVKALSAQLAALGAGMGLDRVFLGVCTGSVACSTALKIMLARYYRDPERSALGPVLIALAGNYHGTDILAQTMRGMWPEIQTDVETVTVEPNAPGELRAVFAEHGPRVAGFWAEPVMMNREAILVDADFLQLARELCAENGALMAIDEIQTGFWYPEVLMTARMGLRPDFVVVGKGLAAGFHPLSGLLYRSDLDILEQYDAISTNGGASLAAYVGLCNLKLIQESRETLAALGARHQEGLRRLAADFPDVIERVNGAAYLTGLKFRDRDDALGFHRCAVSRGLWLRVHAYHPGHSTILMKHSLAADEAVVDYLLKALRELLTEKAWR